MQLVMCCACGHFQPGVRREDVLEPLDDECEKCDGRVFVDNRTDEVTRANN